MDIMKHNLRLFDDGGVVVEYNGVRATMPTSIVNEIVTGVSGKSIAFALGRKLPNMTTRDETIPVSATVPEANFVNIDGGKKKASKMGYTDIRLTAEELAGVVIFHEAHLEDSQFDLIGEATDEITTAIARAADGAIFHGQGENKPATFPDGIVNQAYAKGAYVESSGNTYDDLLGPGGVIAKVEESGYMVNGNAGAVTLRALLRGVKDQNGAPIFMPSMQAAGQYLLDGQRIMFDQNGAIDKTKALLIAGDFRHLVWAPRTSIMFRILREGTIDGVNLAEEDCVGIRFRYRFAWGLTNPYNGIDKSENRFPFAVLMPKGGAAALKAAAKVAVAKG